jgi:hypothetical protein
MSGDLLDSVCLSRKTVINIMSTGRVEIYLVTIQQLDGHCRLPIPHDRVWIGSSLLICGYSSLYTEAVWIGFSSVSHFIWVAHVFWFIHY